MLKKPKLRKETGTVLRIALAQINLIVGDFDYNADKIKKQLKQAKKMGADVVLFPELAVTGYPPEDLLLKESFLDQSRKALEKIVPHSKGLTVIVGYAEKKGGRIYNSAALLCDGKHVGTCRKMLLPNYGVFDEKRYFQEGDSPVRFTLKGATLGITICEDIWEESGPGKNLCGKGGVDLLLNISSSPFHKGKGNTRRKMIQQRARSYRSHIAYVNLVGGQDELVFDGQSLLVKPDGKIVAQGNSFAEELIISDIVLTPKPQKKLSSKSNIRSYRLPATLLKNKKYPAISAAVYTEKPEVEEICSALVLGTRDYVLKNGFSKVVLGLSGGIDSALTAVIAARALGPQNVVGVLMPSPYSSEGSVQDSLVLAKNLGIETVTFPIEKVMKAYDQTLVKVFKGTEYGLAEENLQARIRGNLLMALSNKLGWMVLATGNKSEYSVGYCTLYGDMAGGFAVIKDVPKIWVYKVSRWVNDKEEIIPESIITKAPSAELRPDQKDTDSLPPYDLLDPILLQYIEEDKSVEEIKVPGLSAADVKRVAKLVDASEYKRRQGPPGVKITPKAFGKDRRLPITTGRKNK
ncbi:MAG: NAD+ synthase [Nitrospina sp.]|jgi:NAD+ synthase (glutamine-hydrolysing)|nr:NAD+ synthase [Nitrospina sp.]MBT6716383.1 NAD+ synthase [Nitrospina sp.]